MDMTSLFEQHRAHLHAVAYRMLGSRTEADDAVQDAWLRLSRSDTSDVANLRGWLTTVVARICLDMLRSRTSRGEVALEARPEPAADAADVEAQLADSAGLAVLVVLDTLAPAERVAFVLHDLFGIAFDDIAPLVDRTPEAARQLASRARRRVRGADASEADLVAQRAIVERFLSALRAGDVEGIVQVLDPDVVVRTPDREIRGNPREWARGAVQFAQLLAQVEVALVDGAVGLVFAPKGQIKRALVFRHAGGRIVEVDIIMDPARLAELAVAELPAP
jgi:RNA polymerase sigma-70 factor (ECF subfamily)